MTDPASPKQAPTRLRPAKREAIEHAGLRVFGRLGYTRASIDLITEERPESRRARSTITSRTSWDCSPPCTQSRALPAWPTLSSSRSTPASAALTPRPA